MNSVIFPQLIKPLISDSLCCFWEDALWLLRRGWLMCLFVCCSLENCLSCILFWFLTVWVRADSRGCRGWWREGRQQGKGFSPLCYTETYRPNPYLTLHRTFMPHIPEASSLFSDGRYEGNSLAGLKAASLRCIFYLNCLIPPLIPLLPVQIQTESKAVASKTQIRANMMCLCWSSCCTASKTAEMRYQCQRRN